MRENIATVVIEFTNGDKETIQNVTDFEHEDGFFMLQTSETSGKLFSDRVVRSIDIKGER